ncbi:MAG TPA: 16S rRNA (uracil(1498)-N(3))-methyltransferase [Xanthobacteraceae bacterium]|jgi:16S rRNA (uracil1498-N3)-methyltransferase
MPRYDFRAPRIYVDAALRSGAGLTLDLPQAHYLRNVLRLKPGDFVLVFNGREGEWRASLAHAGKHAVSLVVGERTRAQTPAPDLHYFFAPLKHARLDFMVQKAVELGASRLQPVLTRHAQAARVNLDRMKANAIEAAEQCGILSLPETAPPVRFEGMIAAREAERLLIFCDEDAEVGDPIAALMPQRRPDPRPLAVLVGPEGGFAEHERSTLLALPNVLRISLGPRILRADTAAIAALALVGAVLGDWR